MQLSLRHLIRIGGAAILLLGATQVQATGTASGTAVNNTAVVGYSVGGVAQPTANSNIATFLVDRRINLTVAEVGNAYTDVAPGSTGQVLTFTVTNSSNSTQDLLLTTTQLATNANDPFGGTDDFNVTALQLFVDTNNNGTYDPGTDAAVTFLDEIPADQTRTVFVVSSIPIGQADGNSAGIVLAAQAAEPGTVGTAGAASTQTAGADTAGVIDTVFGDTAGDIDANRDGRSSDTDAYRIQTATIAVVKSSRVISDPFNGTTTPKRIPQAVVEYCVEVTNSGSTAAANVVVTDGIAAQPVTYNPGTIVLNSTSCAVSDGAGEDDNNTGGDETDPNGANFTANTVTATFLNVAGGSTSRVQFRVTIN